MKIFCAHCQTLIEGVIIGPVIESYPLFYFSHICSVTEEVGAEDGIIYSLPELVQSLGLETEHQKISFLPVWSTPFCTIQTTDIALDITEDSFAQDDSEDDFDDAVDGGTSVCLPMWLIPHLDNIFKLLSHLASQAVERNRMKLDHQIEDVEKFKNLIEDVNL